MNYTKFHRNISYSKCKNHIVYKSILYKSQKGVSQVKTVKKSSKVWVEIYKH